MLRQKNIYEYILWLLLSVILGMSIVWIEGTYFLKNIDFLTGFVLNTFNGLRRMLVLYLGNAVGLLSFLFFIPINILIIKQKVPTQKKQILLGFLVILFLIIILVNIHAVLAFKLKWI